MLTGLPVLVIIRIIWERSHIIMLMFPRSCLPVQKNTHYMMIFDAFVILTCLASLVLCARSVIRGLQLQQVSPAPQDPRRRCHTHSDAAALSHSEAHSVPPLPKRSLSTSSFFTTRRKFQPLTRWSSSMGGTLWLSLVTYWQSLDQFWKWKSKPR